MNSPGTTRRQTERTTSIGILLTNRREWAKKSQDDVAAEIGRSRKFVNNVELGKSIPSDDEIATWLTFTNSPTIIDMVQKMAAARRPSQAAAERLRPPVQATPVEGSLDDYEPLHKYARRIRVTNGLSLKDVARGVDYSDRRISRFEKNVKGVFLRQVEIEPLLRACGADDNEVEVGLQKYNQENPEYVAAQAEVSAALQRRFGLT